MSINAPASPVPLPPDPRCPGSGPGDARVRIRRVHEDGCTSRVTVAGLAPVAMHDLAPGSDQLTRVTAPAALTDALPPARLDAGGTRLRLRALHVMGHNSVRIARALDVSETTIRKLLRGNAHTVSPELRDAIADLYDAWWDKRAPQRTPSQRAATTLARRRAIAIPRRHLLVAKSGNRISNPDPEVTSMTLTINDTTMTSDRTAHTARQAPGLQHEWEVSWLPSQPLDRNAAITAMVLADLVGEQDLDEGHRLWPHIQGWAEELGLTAPDAISRATQPPGGIDPHQERAGGQPDLEAAD